MVKQERGALCIELHEVDTTSVIWTNLFQLRKPYLFKGKHCFDCPYFEHQLKCRGLQFCLTLLEVDTTCVQINQSSNPIHCKPSYHALMNSHGDQNVVIESFLY